MATASLEGQLHIWVQRIDRRRRGLMWGVILRAAGGACGALLTPLILIAIATGFFYLLVIVFIAYTTMHQREIIFGIFLSIIYLIYLGMLAWAFRSEYQTGLFLYQGAQRRPPADLIVQTKMEPFLYVPIGLDLLHDDAPVSLLMKLPVYWARILARAWIQWQVYRSIKNENPMPAAQILTELARHAQGVNTEALLNDGAQLAVLHPPLTYLMVLDMIGISPAWSKVWLSPELRRSLPPDQQTQTIGPPA